MQKEKEIDLKDFLYDLPKEKIAFEGSLERDSSKLLYYNKGKIKDYRFKDIVGLIPPKATLVFNNTRVIPARLYLEKKTGATIEIFLLKPALNMDISQALNSLNKVVWKCMIGKLKKWKTEEVLSTKIKIKTQLVILEARLINKTNKMVEFTWNNNHIPFEKLLNTLGNTPLPPYIKRELKNSDKKRYQTVYSKVDGAVAAPTAGLHFTHQILNQLKTQEISQKYLTLHIGAGTFMPIKSDSVEKHPMHKETMVIDVDFLSFIIKSEFIISVGTTSMRTLESLYWYGVKLIDNPQANFNIDKLFPYQQRASYPSKKEAFKAILNYANKNNLTCIKGSTEIFIFPGYIFKVCNGLITNFHQPKSTLILLVAAFVGYKWKLIYDHALQNNYKFLSFGDSSLLIPSC